MKYLAIFVLVFATASAFDLRKVKLEQHNLVVPTEDSRDRIANGQVAVAGEIPYQVGLSVTLSASTSWCGGSLISQDWVLTVAHCTDRILYATVYLGSIERSVGEVAFKVPREDIIIHPGWNRQTIENDICLIKIPPVTYSKNIQPINLPDDSGSTSYFNEDVIASGWGLISDSAISISDTLRWANMEVANIDICKKFYGISNENIVCVYTKGGSSPCSGDSGSPLVLKSYKVQIGLASFLAADGCEKGSPAVFTRLGSYLEWIKVTLASPTKQFYR